MQRSKPLDDQDLLFEFIQHGNAVKITAIDQITGTEVSVVTPINTSRKEMQRLAIAKLVYVLKKNGKAPSAAFSTSKKPLKRTSSKKTDTTLPKKETDIIV